MKRHASSGAGFYLALIPREKIDDVRERTNLVEVVRRHVELKRAGTGSWKGLCPFHAEKSPSFFVHEERQFFHCFGCGEKGDVFGFLMKVDQRSFMEVLRDLAQQGGVDLPEKQMSPAERKALADAASERERMLQVMEAAASFFEANLLGDRGAPARAYLEKRGISPATAAKFRVGYAPPGWDGLQRHLASKRIPMELAETLGLVGMNERGSYDFFRDRVMLPVIDRQKHVVGFSSRLLDPDAKDRKYVNSPDSPLFHKKENLYGLHGALEAIRKSGTAVVVEGNFDVMALHEAGIAEAVAPMGTALTPEQIAILARLARRVVVVFDGDDAGLRAARKSVPLFLDAEVDGRVARLPKGSDPDDFVRQNGAEGFTKLLESARPIVEQHIDDVVSVADVPEKIRSLDELAPILAKVRNAAARELYIGRVAAAVGLPTHQIMKSVRAAAQGAKPATPAGANASAPTAPPTALRRTPPANELEPFVLLVSHPELAKLPEADRIAELLVDQGMRPLYRTALAAMRSGERPDVPAWLDAAAADIRDAVSAAVMNSSYAGHDGPDRVLRSLLSKLERSRIEAEIDLVNRQHKEALARGDVGAARALGLRVVELNQTKLGLTHAPH